MSVESKITWSARTGADWSVERLTSTLVLSGSGIQLFEWWSITAEDHLDELLVDLDIDCGIRTGEASSAAGLLDQLDVYGGELIREAWPVSGDGRPVIGIRLPRILYPQETHTFELALSLPEGPRPVRHLHRGRVPCRALELCVRFGPQFMPATVSLLDGGGGGGARYLPVASTGDVRASFSHVGPGRVHGLWWG